MLEVELFAPTPLRSARILNAANDHAVRLSREVYKAADVHAKDDEALQPTVYIKTTAFASL